MKKKALIILTVLLALWGTTILAVEYANQTGKTVADAVYEAEYAPSFKTDEASVETKDVDAQENPVIKAAQAAGLEARLNGADNKFADLIVNYSMSEEEQQYIADLINEGYDASMLADIFYFWTNCCEDISIIRQMYDITLSAEYEDRYWEEDAYNDATNSAHGVLSGDNLYDYLYVNGTTISDVKNANVLSRRGVFTIQEILQKLIDGQSWADIIQEVYGDFPMDGTENALKATRKFRSGNSISAIANASISQGNTEYKQAVISDGFEKTALSDDSKQLIEEAQANTKKLSAAVNEIFKDETSDQNMLQQKYSANILYNANIISQKYGIELEEVLREYSKTGRWERILKKAVILQ